MFKRGDSVLILVRSHSWPYVKTEEAVVTKVVSEEEIYVKVGRTTLMRRADDMKPAK